MRVLALTVLFGSIAGGTAVAQPAPSATDEAAAEGSPSAAPSAEPSAAPPAAPVAAAAPRDTQLKLELTELRDERDELRLAMPKAMLGIGVPLAVLFTPAGAIAWAAIARSCDDNDDSIDSLVECRKPIGAGIVTAIGVVGVAMTIWGAILLPKRNRQARKLDRRIRDKEKELDATRVSYDFSAHRQGGSFNLAVALR